MGSFDGLSVALSSLYAQRRGLDVTGQNIANANTERYSRQRVALESVGAPGVPALWSQSTNSGSGVHVASIQRLRDAFLESRTQIGHAQLADLKAAHDVMAQIEQLFPEPGDQGLQSHLSDLWNGFHAVANQPSSIPARSQLLQRASIVTDWLNQTAASLTSIGTARTTDLGALVHQANDAAERLANLNQAILQGAQAGLPVNELQDQRDQLAMKLAELVGGTTLADPDGTIGVYLSGSALVRGNRAESMQLASIAGTVQLQWSRDSSAVQVTGGKAHALLEAVNTVLPAGMAELDAVASTLSTKINTLHASGYDLSGAAGGPMLTGSTATTIAVAITDPNRIAASQVPPEAGIPSLDAGNAIALAGIGQLVDSPDSVYQRVIVNLGISSQSMASRVDTQSAIVTNLDAARESDSGVSLDEEMTNLLAFQRAYEAASRVLNAIDSALDTLINRTGLVGR